MDFKVKKGGNAGVLRLDGELTVRHAEEVKAVLMESLDQVDLVELKFTDVTEIDLSCLQLLCSACMTSYGSNKRLRPTGKYPGVVKEVVETAGFARHKGCTFDRDKNCLWLGGND